MCNHSSAPQVANANAVELAEAKKNFEELGV